MALPAPAPKISEKKTPRDSTLAVLGGHDFMIRPILAAGLLKLHEANIEGGSGLGGPVVFRVD